MFKNENLAIDKLVFDLDSSSDRESVDEEHWKNSLSNLSLSRSNTRSRRSSDSTTIGDAGKRNCRKTFCECCKTLYVRLGMKHVIPFLILLLYSAAGGAAFYFIESPPELQRFAKRREILNYARGQVQERVWELHLEKNFTKKRILLAAAEAISWYENYTTVAANSGQSEYQWDLWGAIFYCGTIYTTIGYGNIAPVTVMGQVLTMIYSAFGIPLILFILNDMGEVIGKAAYRLWSLINKNASKSKDNETQQDKFKRNASFNDSASVVGVESTSVVHKLPMSIAFGITLAWMLLCSVIFSLWENWSYFTAFYFFFISLTTIGLGDIVPRHHQFLIMNFGLVLLGLSLVSMCIHVVQAKVEYIAQQLLHRISKRYQTVQVEGGELSSIRADDEIENTLNQIQQPSWLKALVSRRKKENIMNEYKKRAKLSAKFCQTENNWNAKCVAIQTDVDPIDWRKHYERELVNVQQLVQQLEHIYDNQGDKNSSHDQQQSIRSVSSDNDQQRQYSIEETKKKTSNFENIRHHYSVRKKPLPENDRKVVDDAETSPRKTEKRKSFRLAAFMSRHALSGKSPKKRAPPLSTDVLNKNVTITLNDNNGITHLDEEDLSSNMQIYSDTQIDSKENVPRGSNTTISSMPSDYSIDNNDFDNFHQFITTTNRKEIQNKTTLDLPVVHYRHKNKIQDKSNNNNISLENQSTVAQSSRLAPVPTNTCRENTNKLSYHESIRRLSQHRNKPESSLSPGVNITSKNIGTKLDLNGVETFLNNLHSAKTAPQNVYNKNTTQQTDDDDDGRKDIEDFYKTKNQRFQYADDDSYHQQQQTPPSISAVGKTYDVLPEIHRPVLILPKTVSQLENANSRSPNSVAVARTASTNVSSKTDVVASSFDVVATTSKSGDSKMRRLSWSPKEVIDEEEDDREFPRKPYALDDCKLLFAEIKHRIKDCRHILTEQRVTSGFNTPISSSKS